MLVSINTSIFRSLVDNKKILQIIKDTGFECYDFTMICIGDQNFLTCDDYLEKAQDLRKYADSIGLICNQAHAPFPIYFMDNEKESEIRMGFVKKSIEIAHILGAKRIVCHPIHDNTPIQNKWVYDKLLELAKKYNIKISLENMWHWDHVKDFAAYASCSSPKSFIETYAVLDPQYFSCLLDIGHAEMMDFTTAEEMIYALGNKLDGLHIHDNDLKHDSHEVPYTMNINFDRIAKALKKIHYQGELTLEYDIKNLNQTEEQLRCLAKQLYDSVDRIRKLIENK